MPNDPKTIYQGSLSATHAAERQGLQQLEGQLAGLDHYPDYQALVRDHIQVTQGQIERLDRAMAEAGASPSAVKEGVTNAIGTVAAAIHQVFPDTQLKNLYAGYAYQHEQIAAYLSLIEIAEAAGFPQHRSWIEQTLAEEEQGADRAKALIGSVTRTYLQLEQAGESRN